MKLYYILFHFHHSTSRMEENVDEAKQIEDFRLEVLDIDVDLYNFEQRFDHVKIDIQIFTEYIHSRKYSITARRLDQNKGWDQNVNVFVNYLSNDTHIIHTIGQSDSNEKTVFIEPEFDIYPSSTPINRLPLYTMIQSPDPHAISRQDFNTRFNTDIVVLPHVLYAVGIQDGVVYMYNEQYADYYEIIHTVNHINSVILTHNLSKTFYYIICACDGYMEDQYLSERTIPRLIGETEYANKRLATLENPKEYAILHKNNYILGMSVHLNLPFAYGVPDRHYFYCNLYNPFRSFHRGIPFHTKKSQIVFGSRADRGSKYNFINRPELDMLQRAYFHSDAVPKDNIYSSPTEWIDSTMMINYKYILDIDGRASTWDATAWKLNSGSVIFKTESCWIQWFYDEYLPWVHYVPIKNDFGDLQEKFHWCESHQEECKQMVKNSKALFQKIYSYSNIVKDTIRILQQIGIEN